MQSSSAAIFICQHLSYSAASTSTCTPTDADTSLSSAFGSKGIFQKELFPVGRHLAPTKSALIVVRVFFSQLIWRRERERSARLADPACICVCDHQLPITTNSHRTKKIEYLTARRSYFKTVGCAIKRRLDRTSVFRPNSTERHASLPIISRTYIVNNITAEKIAPKRSSFFLIMIKRKATCNNKAREMAPRFIINKNNFCIYSNKKKKGGEKKIFFYFLFFK